MKRWILLTALALCSPGMWGCCCNSCCSTNDYCGPVVGCESGCGSGCSTCGNTVAGYPGEAVYTEGAVRYSSGPIRSTPQNRGVLPNPGAPTPAPGVLPGPDARRRAPTPAYSQMQYRPVQQTGYARPAQNPNQNQPQQQMYYR